MASTPDTLTSNQLKLARVALWRQNGDALRTLDDVREWLDTAGLVAYTPHAQFAAAPQPSFAEAVLGRPENGWIPPAENSGPSEEESYAVEVEDEEPAEEVADPDEDDDEPADAVEFADAEASDDEVMVSNDDEFAEDEGDEIAEEDRINAGEDPVPNDLREEHPEPEAKAINGFSAEEREEVRRMLARLVEDGAAVPLNLLGSTTGEPDFVCSAQAFSFVYTLRGDKNFKNEPAQTGAMRVSPLAAKVYALLKEKGAMAPHELTAELGQGIVDSAVLRALSELWSILRVVPIPDANGEPATWELTTGRYLRHIKAGANAGQPTALSALLSLYLSQAVAATSDEMEIFLSPLAARSRVREVVHGLSASRQLESVVAGGKTVHFLPGALNDLPEDVAETPAEPVVQPRSRYEDDDRRAMIEARNARFAAEGGAPPERKPFRKDRGEGGFRPRREGGFAPRRENTGERREGGFAPRREGGFTPQRRSGGFAGNREGFAPRGERGGFDRSERERRPFNRREEGGAAERPRNEFARPWDEERGERKRFTPREDRPFAPRGERPAFGDRKPFGERKSFGDREGGERRPFTPRGDRPFTPRGERPAFGDRKPSGARKNFGDREGGEGRPFSPRGDRRPSGDREGGERRPFTPREGRPSFGDRKPYGERRSFEGREGGDRPFTPRGERPAFGDRKPFNERKSFGDREGGDRRPFTPRGERPFTPRGDRKPFAPREGGERRPFAPREGRPSYGDRKPFGGRKPFGADRGGSSEGRGERERFSGEPGESRPAFRSGGKSAGPGGAKFGGSGFGRDRKGAPGNYGKPGFKPSRKGPGSGPGRGGAPKRRPE